MNSELAQHSQFKDRATGRFQLKSLIVWPLFQLFRFIEWPMQRLQRLLGLGTMPYVFLLPNLCFFGLFVVLPLFINFAFSLTGGTNLFLDDRIFTGTEQYAFLLDCGNYADPLSCREDRFWKSIFNTAIFITFQLSFLVFFSLITALVLNKKIRARGFFSIRLFFPSFTFSSCSRFDLEMGFIERWDPKCLASGVGV
jgi:alpha-1,4-digalacturonate transport system permease protein